jgi:hypothetical protein
MSTGENFVWLYRSRFGPMIVSWVGKNCCLAQAKGSEIENFHFPKNYNKKMSVFTSNSKGDML